MEAATHWDRAAALHPASAMKGQHAAEAVWCRRQADTKYVLLKLEAQLELEVHRRRKAGAM